MKEFAEKPISRLEEEHERCINQYGTVGGNIPASIVKKCIAITNRLAEEFVPDIYVGNKDGWIPVEEGLPEEGKDVLVWYEYFRYGEYNTMFQTYGIGYQYKGHWCGDVKGTKARCIAWQPLPAPYEAKGE